MVNFPYCWVITKDRLGDPKAPKATSSNALGLYGPSTAIEAHKVVTLMRGDKFRMYDDDGELYYEGKLLIDRQNPDITLFEPLDDFGFEAGCTGIQYKDENGVWCWL